MKPEKGTEKGLRRLINALLIVVAFAMALLIFINSTAYAADYPPIPQLCKVQADKPARDAVRKAWKDEGRRVQTDTGIKRIPRDDQIECQPWAEDYPNPCEKVVIRYIVKGSRFNSLKWPERVIFTYLYEGGIKPEDLTPNCTY